MKLNDVVFKLINFGAKSLGDALVLPFSNVRVNMAMLCNISRIISL